MNLKERAKQLKTDIPTVFLALKDKETPALVALTIRFIPKEVLEKNRTAAEGLWADGKPKKWYYGIPVVVIWVVIVGLIINAIWFK